MSITACSDQSFAFGTGGRTHPSPYGGRHEVRTRGLPFVRTPARRRRDCRGLYERGSGPPLFFCFIPVCSDSISCALRAVERGLLWGRCPPSRPLSNPPNHPPYLALRLCVHCPPVPTKASLFGTGGRIHPSPHGGGGMKLRQGCYPSCVPRPAAGGIAGGSHERGSGPPLFFCFIPVCSDSIPCALRAGERGLLWGRCPPSRPLSKPPNHPPYLALSILFTARLFQQKLRFRNRRAHTSIPAWGAA